MFKGVYGDMILDIEGSVFLLQSKDCIFLV